MLLGVYVPAPALQSGPNLCNKSNLVTPSKKQFIRSIPSHTE
ncbi:hypothetical protein HMPREF9104_03155 [Lentilactobacillus kisonensis F0435]|uniref:Uncharacterized protein n=1 Tax=Lentilactobacillus kisonensis F0435 TaxID=797516 RepID=H1LKK1_9LACO|nr:hypothetical protein HMPREF9104_03155 [Lentilactobacillus kisonensis F0435]